MEQKEMNDKLLRVEHEWIQHHVAPYLHEGGTYTIELMDGSRISGVTFHFCSLLGKHYFTLGAGVYPIESVYAHSLKGDAAIEKILPETDIATTAITGDYDEVTGVVTTPDTNPLTYRRRIADLMLSGMSQAEAQRHASARPMQLALFYDVGRGAFAIDSEAVGNTPLYNPYTGEMIQDKTT